MKTTRLCTLALATAALAACQQPAADTASPGSGAPAAEGAASPASTPAGDTVEARVRAGLWQSTVTFPGGGGGSSVTSRVCMDDQMTALSAGSSQSQLSEGCTQNTTRTAQGYAFTSRCDAGSGGVTETVGNLTGDFQTSYRMEATVTTSGASMAAMNRSTQVVTVAEYQGPCPDGWRAGDVEIPGMGGARLNIYDMQEQAAAREHAG